MPDDSSKQQRIREKAQALGRSINAFKEEIENDNAGSPSITDKIKNLMLEISQIEEEAIKTIHNRQVFNKVSSAKTSIQTASTST